MRSTAEIIDIAPRLEAALPVVQIQQVNNESEASIEADPAPQAAEETVQNTSAQVASSSPILENLAHIARFLLLTVRGVWLTIWFSIKTCVYYLVKHPIHALINTSLILIIGLMLSTGTQLHQKLILAQISDETIDQVIQGSRFTREYDAEEIARGGTREFLRPGAPVWAQREGVRAILFYARQANLAIEDQAVLLAVADIESGFNPTAHAGITSACGLFQFVRATGATFNLSPSECMNPWHNAKSGVSHYLYNYERRVKSKVEGLVGPERVFRLFELSYYLHHDGPDSNNPSSEVKATILSGTQFLFKAYRALLSEAESQKRAPSFTETFAGNFWKVVNQATRLVRSSEHPLLQQLGAIYTGNALEEKA